MTGWRTSQRHAPAPVTVRWVMRSTGNQSLRDAHTVEALCVGDRSRVVVVDPAPGYGAPAGLTNRSFVRARPRVAQREWRT